MLAHRLNNLQVILKAVTRRLDRISLIEQSDHITSKISRTVRVAFFTKKESLMANQRGRDARTGQFIPVPEAIRRPSTTVVETIRTPSKPKAK